MCGSVGDLSEMHFASASPCTVGGPLVHMNLVRKLVCLTTLLAVLNLLGCAQIQVAALRKKCDFEDDPRFEVLRGKVPLSPRASEAPPTLIELSNNSKPTPAER